MQPGELIHRPPTSRQATPPVDAVRAFVFLSGLRWIRDNGHDERLWQLIPPRFHDWDSDVGVTDWVPIDVALEIYSALDALALPVPEQMALGRYVALANNGVIVSTVVRLAGKMGISPWTALARLHGVWLRNNRGGAVAVYRLGDRAARLEFWSVPFASSDFFRTSLRGSIAAGLEPFAGTIRVTEMVECLEHDSFAFRVAW